MTKDLFIATHEELIERYIEKTGCDYATAYDATVDKAYNRYTDKYADMIDQARQRHKDGC